MKLCLSLFTVLLLTYHCSAQQNCNSFTLKGTINTDTGVMQLFPVRDISYYPYRTNLETGIDNGKFTFTDSIAYPTAYRLGLRINKSLRYLSDVFYIDPCVQTISCHIDSNWEMPAISNNTMRELTTKYNPCFKSVNLAFDKLYKTRDSLKKQFNNALPVLYSIALKNREDSLDKENIKLIVNYATKHPGSYLVLWKIAYLLHFGYYPAYENAFAALSPTIRNSHTGSALAKELTALKSLSTGKHFPALQLLDTAFTQAALPLIRKGQWYILINFWKSDCTPCLKQFDAYKRIYAQYKNDGFQIISISVDKTNDVDNWQKAIKEKELPWPQFLDLNGTNATRLSIEAFPTNYLIDENGIIIRKNISPEELEKLLAYNTKQ